MNKRQEKFEAGILTIIVIFFMTCIAANTYYTIYNEGYRNTGLEYVVFAITIFAVIGFGVMSYLSWMDYLDG